MSDSDSETEPTIAESQVVSKYTSAGKIADNVMKALIEKCVDGATTLELCKFGDELVATEVSAKYKKIAKGTAFPTCISVNNCICHYSPLESEKEVVVLKDGDVVKIDIAVHIDGFIAASAHTLVVGCNKENPVTDRRADVIKAAHTCAEAALRLVKPGNKNNEVTKIFNDIAASYNCKPVEGMLSHQLGRNRIDGDKTIIQNPTEKQRQEHEECEFEVHEVYAVDCLVSTGEGRPKDFDTRTTIYKRNPEVVYSLKMKTSRAVFNEIDKKFNTMCFTLRAMEDEKKARLGIVECFKHNLCTPFPVMWEKKGEFVAQFKFTVLLLPNLPCKITSSFFDDECYKSSMSITDQHILDVLKIPTNRKNVKAKKKKKQKQAQAALAKANEEAGTGEPVETKN